MSPIREDLPTTRPGRIFEAKITSDDGVGDAIVIITVNTFPSGEPAEVFLQLAKHGSTLAGLIDTIAIIISKSLSRGVKLDEICRWITDVRFEPLGWTDDPDVPTCKSIIDYVARKLLLEYGSEC